MNHAAQDYQLKTYFELENFFFSEKGDCNGRQEIASIRGARGYYLHR